MANENNTNAPRPLSPDQVKARDAALAASKGATPQVPALPGTAPLGVTPVTVEHKPINPALVTALEIAKATYKPQQGDAGKPADMAKPVNPTDTGTPVKPTPESQIKGLDALAAANPKSGILAAAVVEKQAQVKPVEKQVLPDLTADAAHKAAMTKANASTGKPPQGGTVTKGKGNTPTPAVTAAKVKKLTKAETAMADPANVEAYALHKWPVINSPVDGKPVPAPSRVDIIAAKALDQTGSGPTANRLALAFYLSAYAAKLNLYEASMAGGKYVCGLSGDHKMNVASKAEGDGLVTIDKATHLPWSNGAGGGRLKVCYVCKPTAKGLKLIEAALNANGLKVPARWLPSQAPKPASDKGKVPAASQVANTGK